MEKILEALCGEQWGVDTSAVTLLLSTGDKITGVIQSTEGGVVSISRSDTSGNDTSEIPRHFAISAVVGAYYTEGS